MVGVYGFSFFAGFVALHDTPDDTVFRKNQFFSFHILGSSLLLVFSPSRFDLSSSSSYLAILAAVPATVHTAAYSIG